MSEAVYPLSIFIHSNDRRGWSEVVSDYDDLTKRRIPIKYSGEKVDYVAAVSYDNNLLDREDVGSS